MLSLIEYLRVPSQIALVLAGFIFILQIIGEIAEFKGRVVPWFMKIRKCLAKRKANKLETPRLLSEVRQLLTEVNGHYSADNIAKRDSWMKWVNDRAVVYDESIEQIRDTLKEFAQALKDNTKMAEELFIQNSRDRIIDFATKVENRNTMVSREEFNRIFKVYDKYEKFLKERKLTNGEIDINYQIIKESYEEHLHNHTFIEDVRGYN